MWGPDDFPGRTHVPWRLIIRADYAHEIDAILASVVFNEVAAVASSEVAHRIAAAGQTTVHSSEPATAEQKLAALSAFMDFDGPVCGTHYPGWWPHGPHRFDTLSDPITNVVLAKSAELVRLAGSEELNKSLGSVLAEGAHV